MARRKARSDPAAALIAALTPRNGEVPPFEAVEGKPVLSLTGDILSYSRCPRQYGLQKVRGFAPARMTQEFIGSFAHQALDRAFRHFVRTHQAPTNEEMAQILVDVKELLRDQRRFPHSWTVANNVAFRIMRLNRSFDARGVYARIVDTERTLQADAPTYVIQGRVDVIQASGQELELWDYKATKNPRRVLGPVSRGRRGPSEIDLRAAHARLREYDLQLRLYAYLHERVYMQRVARCKLLFISEVMLPSASLPEDRTQWSQFAAQPLSDDEWQDTSDAQGGSGLFYSVQIGEEQVDDALQQFGGVAARIIECRRNDVWPAPEVAQLPDKATCDACDGRWTCPTADSQHDYRSRIEGLEDEIETD